MRIAQVTPVYPPYRGGMARVAFEYTERLRARGHDVEVFAPRIRAGNAGLLPPLASDVAGFEIVHLHYPFYGGAEPIAHARSSGQILALVVTFHMDATARGVKGAVFDVHRETVQPWILSQADRLLVSSRDYAAVSSLARVDGALDRAEVLPLGVDLNRFHPGDEAPLRATLGIHDRTPVILFVGGMDAAHRFKGLDVLFAALAALLHVPWQLVIVGEGSDRAGFERDAIERRLMSRITFAGDVEDDALPCYYRMAAVHVLPSTSLAEAFGLVTLEASASGVPSVVSDLPGVRNTVIHGATGLVVRPADADALRAAIQELLTSADRRALLGRQARRRVERDCSWDVSIDRLETIYRSVIR